ncbi:MAG: SDR family oxidoreductase [Acidobacteriota bacterium]|jgi:3-oxoacyl-[acyl-carrier protein] reductase|nr:SDR family oxidoreductase [Acidobacteriota bacterium]
MDINLTDKKAFVCGSTQGIGRAAAIKLADLGASVILLARNEYSLKQVKNELNTSQNQRHDFIVVDFSKPEELKNKVAEYLQNNNQPVQILINNTGGPPAGKAIDAQLHEFINAFQNHLLCNQILVQSLVEQMKAERYGRIVNVISTSVKQPIPNLGVSNTIRGAVANWAKTLAGELGEFGITVNNVLPGFTKTQRLQSIIENKASKAGVSIEQIEAEMKSEAPAKRFAEASEVANAIAFLASPAASYINGVNLPVDGGRTGCL